MVLGNRRAISTAFRNGAGEEMDRNTGLGDEGKPPIGGVAKLDATESLAAAGLLEDTGSGGAGVPILWVRLSSHSRVVRGMRTLMVIVLLTDSPNQKQRYKFTQ